MQPGSSNSLYSVNVQTSISSCPIDGSSVIGREFLTRQKAPSEILQLGNAIVVGPRQLAAPVVALSGARRATQCAAKQVVHNFIVCRATADHDVQPALRRCQPVVDHRAV